MAARQLGKNNANPARRGTSKDIVWNLFGTFSYMFSLWIISILTMNTLGESGAGVLSLAMIVSNIATSFGSYYVRVYYASDVSKRFSDEDYFFTRMLTNAGGVLIALVFSLAMRYSLATIMSIMLFYLYKVCELFTEIHSGAFQRQGKMYLGSILMGLKGLIVIPFFLVGARLCHSLDIGILLMDAVALLFLPLELLFLKKFTAFHFAWRSFSWRQIGKILRICFPLFLVLLCSNLLPSIPKLLFEKMYGEDLLGFYSSIATISVLIQTAASSVLLPVLPKISLTYLKKRFASFYKLLILIAALVIAMGLLAYVLTLFLGDWALGLFFRDRPVLEYSYTFKATVVAGTFTALFVVLNQILAAVGGGAGLIIGSLAGTLACLGVSYPLCKYAFMNGISYALDIALGLEVAIFLGFILFHAERRRRGKDQEQEPPSLATVEAAEMAELDE